MRPLFFRAVPRLPLLVTYWLGEDEFPSNAKILFDSNSGEPPADRCLCHPGQYAGIADHAKPPGRLVRQSTAANKKSLRLKNTFSDMRVQFQSQAQKIVVK